LQWLYGPEKFPGLLRNGPQGRVVPKPVKARVHLNLIEILGSLKRD